MATTKGFIDHLIELLTAFGEVTPRRMFGGVGLYHDGLMFAIVADDILYLKADDENRLEFESQGLRPFEYDKQGKTVSVSYYEAPAEALESQDEMKKWAESAWLAAVRSAQSKKKVDKS